MEFSLPDLFHRLISQITFSHNPVALLYYLAVPLKTERHQTLGQKVNAIRPVDYSSLFSVSRRQLLIRFLSYALFYFYLPLFLLFWAGGEAVLLPRQS